MAPYAASVAAVGAVVALGNAGIGGLSAAAGVNLAQTNAAATLGYTAWAGVKYSLFGGDGAWVARQVGGTRAAPRSTASRVVADVSASFASDGIAERPPQAWVIPTDEPNAFAAGRGNRTIVAPAGLLRRLGATSSPRSSRTSSRARRARGRRPAHATGRDGRGLHRHGPARPHDLDDARRSRRQERQ